MKRFAKSLKRQDTKSLKYDKRKQNGMIKGSVKYKHYAIITLICMILMSGLFVAETQVVNEKAKATITGFLGCTKKNDYAKGKYGKTQYTYYVYGYHCVFTDKNGKEHVTIMEDKEINTLKEEKYKAGDSVTIYYKKDYTEGDSVRVASDVYGVWILLMCFWGTLTAIFAVKYFIKK